MPDARSEHRRRSAREVGPEGKRGASGLSVGQLPRRMGQFDRELKAEGGKRVVPELLALVGAREGGERPDRVILGPFSGSR